MPFANWSGRGAALATLALAAAALFSGCDNDYNAELRYPERTDPLITKAISASPSKFDPPGLFPNTLSMVPADDLKKADVLDPAKLQDGFRGPLYASLEKFFGRPAEPKVDGIEDSARDTLKLDKATLAKGASLYRLHCLHCHGLSGNGRGPTAPWVNPHPRDYRLGVFKFTSSSQTQSARKPRRDDLKRTIREGVEGTSMPSFSLLPPEEIEALTSYVIHLSIRGEVEYTAIKDLMTPGTEDMPASGNKDAMDTFIKENELPFVAKLWVEAQGKTIVPEGTFPQDMQASAKRGQALFQAGCIACHEDYGRKDHLLFDVWGTVVRPADLTRGVYRGGRRPIDLYWRVHGGIAGVNMPEPSGGPDKSRDVWDLVNFVRILPYPEMRAQYGVEIDPPAKKDKDANAAAGQ